MNREELLIVVDVGNTNTVCGVFQGDEFIGDYRLSTDVDRTADEYAALLLPLFTKSGIDPAVAEGVVICSVVPPLTPCFQQLSQRYFHQDAFFVEPGVRTSLAIRYDNPTEVGADRIVNALAARELYGAPVVVVDFGTATTFDIVNSAGDYAGGVIAPGLVISAEALFSLTLPVFTRSMSDVPRSSSGATPAPPCNRDSSSAMWAWSMAFSNDSWRRSPM